MTKLLQNQDGDRTRDKNIGQIEAGKVMGLKMEVKEVNDIAAHNAVNGITDDARIENRLGDGTEARRAEDRPTLPDEECEDDESEGGKRPDLPLQETPRAPAVLDIGEIEEVWDDRKGRGPFQVSRGEFLRHRIDENEVDDGGEDDKKPSHRSVRSMSLWHSMHVRTNGWFKRRGLRMSFPHAVQTPYVPSSMRWRASSIC